MEQSLNEHRKNASEQSLGLSHEAIYLKAIELLKESPASGHHLDFGSGQGRLLSLMKQSYPEMTLSGVDLMSKPQDLSESIHWQSCDLNSELNLGKDLYDSVSAIEIIEHLENPRHVFRQLYRILKPGGLLVLSTPNNESWRSLLSYIKRGHFVAFTDRSYPAHITALNRKDLLRAASEAGFQFKQWSTSGLGCLPGLTRFTWQQVSVGLLKGLRFSDNIFIVLTK